MEFTKICYGTGPTLEAMAIFALLMVAGALYAWSSLRPPRPPEWSLTGRARRRG